MTETKITFERIGTGQFVARRDGAETGYSIVNGSLGLSGRDTRNVYGVVLPDGRHRWIGSLASCKKLIVRRLAVA